MYKNIALLSKVFTIENVFNLWGIHGIRVYAYYTSIHFSKSGNSSKSLSIVADKLLSSLVDSFYVMYL